MTKRNRLEAPRRERDGLVSRILLHDGDPVGAGMTVTWVEVAPGCEQRPHSHAPEQVYVIARGRGRMHIGEEERPVVEGDLVYVPPGTAHGIENCSGEVSTCVSAATPNVDWRAYYEEGPLEARR